MNEIIQTIAVYALPVVFAITLHEAAHAYAARFFGDNTAYSMGRMSLNPVRHIDPFGTILIPVLMYVATAGNFLFGYAKPVPVDWSRLRNPKRDMAWVALAGPGANFVMAFMWMVMGIFLSVSGITEPFLTGMVRAGILSNLVIFAFNLFPVPPLDGGRVLTSMLPNRLAYRFSQIEPYGFFIVLGLVFLNVLSFWMLPVMGAASAALSLIISPLNLFLN